MESVTYRSVLAVPPIQRAATVAPMAQQSPQ